MGIRFAGEWSGLASVGLEGRMRTWMAMLVGALLSLGLCAGAGAQTLDDSLATGWRELARSRLLFTREDVDTLAELCGLSELDTRRAEELVFGAREAIRAEFLLHSRELMRRMRQHDLRDDSEEGTKWRSDETIGDFEKHWLASQEIERKLLHDLRDLVGNEEDAGWEAFLRSRRRVGMATVQALSAPTTTMDLVLALRSIGIGRSELERRPELKAIVAAYERDADAAIIALRAAKDRLESARKAGPIQEQDAGDGYRKSTDAVLALQARTYRVILEQLSEKEKIDFTLARIRARSPSVLAGQPGPGLTKEDVLEVLAVKGLSDAQLSEMRGIVDEAERQLAVDWAAEFEMSDKLLVARVSGKRNADAERRQMEQAERREYRRRSATIMNETLERMVGVLTPDQRRLYDAGLGVDFPTVLERGREVEVIPELRIPTSRW